MSTLPTRQKVSSLESNNLDTGSHKIDRFTFDDLIEYSKRLVCSGDRGVGRNRQVKENNSKQSVSENRSEEVDRILQDRELMEKILKEQGISIDTDQGKKKLNIRSTLAVHIQRGY